MVQEYDNRKTKLSLAYAFAISNSLLNIKNIIIQGSAILYLYNMQLNMLVAGISVAMYVYALLFHEKRFVVFTKQIFLIFCIFLFWFLSYIVNPGLFDYSYVQEEVSEFIIYALPAVLFLPSLEDCEELMLDFYKCRWILFVAACISVFLMLRSGTIQDAGTRASVYSMAFGRAMLLPTLLFLSKWYQDHVSIDLICGILCTLFILVFGSRFPILCIAIFVAWKFLQTPFGIKKGIFFSCALVAFVILAANFDKIIIILAEKLTALGINSRSLVLITSGLFNYDSGRGAIFSQLFEKINDSPFIGYGAGGGIVVLNNVLPHSFVIDVFANLGYIIGLIFLIVTFYSIWKLYHNNRYSFTGEYLRICICSFFPICLIQTSMWTATYFWILLSLCCGRMSARKVDAANGIN